MFIHSEHLQDSENPKDDVNRVTHVAGYECVVRARQPQCERHEEQ